MADWSDELKEKAKTMYLERNPTPENSMDIVKEVAEELDKTANGVRRILSTAKVYIKKETTTATKTDSGDKPKKISKADAVSGLVEAIKSTGQEVNDDIIGKLTGLAATYFTGIIKGCQSED